MRLDIKELKELVTKLNLAIEKSKINPKASWIELETVNDLLNFKVSNYDYYVEMSVKCSNDVVTTDDGFHVTVLADTFVPLISKLDASWVTMYEKMNTLILETDSSSYTFPIIKELGKTKCIDKIEFNATSPKYIADGNDLETVASVNAVGMIDSIIMKDIQQFIYVDEQGALTFTENIYVNDFKTKVVGLPKFLLNITQAKLLNIFKKVSQVEIEFEQVPIYDSCPTMSNKIRMCGDGINLILITQSQDVVDRFPSLRIRSLVDNDENTHVVISKRILDKALARLMVFDKKFDMTIMDYSKLVFKKDVLELVSIKNKNIEKIAYISSQNVVEHESIIRFADLVKQLKAINSSEIDISYGSRPAIVLNSTVKQVIPEIVLK